MRYSPDHKEKTREKVVKTAARALRREGPERLGVAGVMAEAGLTHGGFYAHFASKDALLSAAVEEAFAHGRRRFAETVEGRSGQAALEAYVDMYVSRRHRDSRERGCPITALAGDIARQDGEVRAAFDKGVRSLTGRLAAMLPDGDDTLAASLLAEMAGAVTLARAVSDPALSDDLLARSRAAIKARVAAAYQDA